MRSDDGGMKGNERKEENEGGFKHNGDLTTMVSSIVFAEKDSHRVRRVLASCDK
jgi:hypothetical protein